ncbi:MAG: selenocysteine-specific translation elongation factor, partial [Thermodesulfovibrionia bacterium]|nr:selenocysteine-specific translation elongation factor [Thermodesulfovibrionia bacterium]
MRYVILGTAGHIDHGKSTLVHALTGIDPDRLREEKERGITIDLGFAYLNYPPCSEAGPDGLRIGIVDVPGHEKLVKNMLAGAGGIDIVLLVIAADEGIMPQSKEHLAICNLLKINKGIIVLTKTDLVEQDWLELITDDIKKFVKGTFLEGAEIIPFSSKTRDNLELVREKIREVSLSVEPKPAKGIFRLPVDRVFTLKGFGTVVTGTAISGSISLDSPLQVLPKDLKTKVRGLHSHGKLLKTAFAGQRVAINLQGIEKEDIQRGDVLTIPGKIKPTSSTDATIELLKDISFSKLKNRSLVHFHSGTSELIARIILYDKEELKPGDSAYCQLRFQGAVTLMAGDRYIIRRFSPLLTIGGGEILDPSPHWRKRKGGYVGTTHRGRFP